VLALLKGRDEEGSGEEAQSTHVPEKDEGEPTASSITQPPVDPAKKQATPWICIFTDLNGTIAVMDDVVAENTKRLEQEKLRESKAEEQRMRSQKKFDSSGMRLTRAEKKKLKKSGKSIASTVGLSGSTSPARPHSGGDTQEVGGGDDGGDETDSLPDLVASGESLQGNNDTESQTQATTPDETPTPSESARRQVEYFNVDRDDDLSIVDAIFKGAINYENWAIVHTVPSSEVNFLPPWCSDFSTPSPLPGNEEEEEEEAEVVQETGECEAAKEDMG